MSEAGVRLLASLAASILILLLLRLRRGRSP